MAGKYEIIARYTDGIPKYWIGRKIDPKEPLDEDNVQWKIKDGMPLVFHRYEEAQSAVE